MRLRLTETDGPLGPVYDNEDGATPSGESTALELFALLARRTDAPEATTRANRLQAALSGRIASQPIAKIDALRVVEIGGAGESDLRRALAGGKARLRVRMACDRARWGRRAVAARSDRRWRPTCRRRLAGPRGTDR